MQPLPRLTPPDRVAFAPSPCSPPTPSAPFPASDPAGSTSSSSHGPSWPDPAAALPPSQLAAAALLPDEQSSSLARSSLLALTALASCVGCSRAKAQPRQIRQPKPASSTDRAKSPW